MDGALMEVGPYRLKDDAHLEYNDGAWDEFANLLFVDQPVGTGFSYVDTNAFIHELTEMADQFIRFMEKWFEIFPQYEDDDVRNLSHFLISRQTDFSRSTSPANPTPANISPTSPAQFSIATKLQRLQTSISGTCKVL